ncbi:MAG: acyl-CoA dehydrogenase C-terminal domain-containing protein [Lysobacter sp.]|nr:acyl-CoA dehydrogenase C-terminal domain-containing protein [Lysobacter sp.]
MHHPDASQRARSDALVALLTPVVKAGFTDLGFESVVQAQQVFGGHGYIRESGMEQYVRDARIAQLYEGTNGVQAMDLVGRKLALGGGTVVDGFLRTIAADLAACGGETSDAVGAALALLAEATETLKTAEAEAAGGAAVEYLRLFTLVAIGWMWVRMAAVPGDTPQHRAKRALASFYAQRVLPQARGLADAVKAGPASLFLLSAEAL